MKKFTDLLDDYLEADKAYKIARENFKGGYDFDYFNHRIVDRLRTATDELNQAFEKLTGEKHETENH